MAKVRHYTEEELNRIEVYEEEDEKEIMSTTQESSIEEEIVPLETKVEIHSEAKELEPNFETKAEIDSEHKECVSVENQVQETKTAKWKSIPYKSDGLKMCREKITNFLVKICNNNRQSILRQMIKKAEHSLEHKIEEMKKKIDMNNERYKQRHTSFILSLQRQHQVNVEKICKENYRRNIALLDMIME